MSIFRLSSLNDLRITEGEEFLRKSADEIYMDILCKDVELKILRILCSSMLQEFYLALILQEILLECRGVL